MCYVRDNIAELQTPLLKFCVSLTRNKSRAEDVCSEAILRAVEHADQFTDSNLPALRRWVFTIAKNYHFSSFRKASNKREVPLFDYETVASSRAVNPTQDPYLDVKDALAAVATLPEHHKEVIFQLCVGASYKEIAMTKASYRFVPALAEGTVRSRINRARKSLKKALHVDV